MDWEKYYCIIVNDVLQSATLYEFLMNEECEKIEILKNDFVYEEEYPEYIQDSSNWIPLRKYFTNLGVSRHWSAIRTIRLIAKIKQKLMLIDNEEVGWIYRSLQHET